MTKTATEYDPFGRPVFPLQSKRPEVGVRGGQGEEKERATANAPLLQSSCQMEERVC